MSPSLVRRRDSSAKSPAFTPADHGRNMRYGQDDDIPGGCSMRAKLAVLVAGIGLVAAAAPVVAHHSFAAEYDSSKPITLKGTVTRVEWTNPHARFYVDVKEESGS